MGTKAFNLVSPNTGNNRRPNKIDVSNNIVRVKRTQLEIGRITFYNKRSSVASDAEGGGYPVRATRKHRKRRGRLHKVTRLVQNTPRYSERLVSP